MKEMIKEKAKAIILWIIIIIVVNIVLLSIQTVKSYTVTLSNGAKVTIGYDRGIGGMFGDWHFILGNDFDIKIEKGEKLMAQGVLSDKEGVEEVKSSLEKERAKLIKNIEKVRISYGIYNLNETYYAVGMLKKDEDLGLVVYTDKKMSEDDAVDMLSRFRGTRGIGYWIATFFSDD